MKFTFPLTIITIFFLNSCASNFYQVPIAQGNLISSTMLSKLETGLSKAQVQFIMGTPSISDPFNSNRWDYIGFEIVGERVYKEVHHTLIFEEGELLSWKKRLENSVNESIEDKAKKLSIEKSEQ